MTRLRFVLAIAEGAAWGIGAACLACWAGEEAQRGAEARSRRGRRVRAGEPIGWSCPGPYASAGHYSFELASARDSRDAWRLVAVVAVLVAGMIAGVVIGARWLT